MKVIILTILLLSLFSCVFAQEARKIEEFSANISCEDYLNRMDNVINESLNNTNSKVFVFVYEGITTKYRHNTRGDFIGETKLLPQFGQAKERIRTIKKRLLFSRFPEERFVFIEAGFCENLTVEFWLVPNELIPPKPTPTLTKMKYRKGKPIGFCLSSGA